MMEVILLRSLGIGVRRRLEFSATGHVYARGCRLHAYLQLHKFSARTASGLINKQNN